MVLGDYINNTGIPFNNTGSGVNLTGGGGFGSNGTITGNVMFEEPPKKVVPDANKLIPLSIARAKFIQASGILGLSGPIVGLSLLKVKKEYYLYWFYGNSSGYDLPNIDFGKTRYISFLPNIDWPVIVSGKSTEYGISVAAFGKSVGGNQKDDQTWLISGEYITSSQMLNFGFNDFGFGVIKNTTYMFPIKHLPRWLGIYLWYFN